MLTTEEVNGSWTYVEEVLAIELPSPIPHVWEVQLEQRVICNVLSQLDRRQLWKTRDVHHPYFFIQENLHAKSGVVDENEALETQAP